MRAHPYFSYFIIPLFKKKKSFFNSRQLGNGLGKNQAKINIHFLKSLDFLDDMEGKTGERGGRQAERSKL